MFVRSVLAFVALPGVVAFLLPGLLASMVPRSERPGLVALVVFGVGLLGWTLGFRTVALAVYAVVVAIAFHLRVVWQVYARSVHRWIGRRRAPSRMPGRAAHAETGVTMQGVQDQPPCNCNH